MQKVNEAGFWRTARRGVMIGAVMPMTMVPQVVSAGILAPQGLRSEVLIETGADLMPHLELGLGRATHDGGLIEVSGPCPDDIDNGGGGNVGFLEVPGMDVADASPALDELIRQSDALAAEAQVTLASCFDGPIEPTDPVKLTGTLDKSIKAVNDTCDTFQIQYRVYCLANQYKALAQQLPSGGQYFEMKRILNDTADQLRALADENADAEAPQARVTDVPRRAPAVARAPLPAIRADRVEATAAAATVILQNAQILLIRSVEDSEARYAAYQTVASGMDNSMLLLRS
ncbi:hypothetical protein H7F16_13115 [Gemmobacter straminiformis]|uniref:Uncharacterized protein n=2 Tax=Paragemmobacter straminiformis TaxID=2045119 RepID=A0A842IAL9_9RHOB|nr:hypothetical protein [Gemmobacter straminiformis]